MSCEYLLLFNNCLRFNDKETRQERTKEDPSIHIDGYEIFLLTLPGFHGVPLVYILPNKSFKYRTKSASLLRSTRKILFR